MAKAKSPSDFNLMDAYEFVQRLVTERLGVQAGMEQLIDWCAKQFPHPAWRILRGFDFETDVAELKAWLVGVFREEPPSPAIRILSFGLFNPIVGGRATCGLYVSGTRAFYTDVGAGDWDWKDRYWPDGRYAESRFLDLLYQEAYAKGGPENLAEYTLGLGYAALAISALGATIKPAVLLNGAPERALSVDFDSGDSIFTGVVRADGLHPIDLNVYRKPTAPEDPDTTLYEIVPLRTGRWWIDEVLEADGEYLPGGFEETGEREITPPPLMAKIRDKKSKVDFNFPVMGPPVVRRAVAELLEQMAPDSIQRLPVKIKIDKDEWEVVNIVGIVSWKTLQDADVRQKDAPWRAAFSGPKIFRTGNYPGPIAVTREIMAILVSRQVSGLIFSPLGRENPWRHKGLSGRAGREA